MIQDETIVKPLLRIDQILMRFGGVTALDQVSFSVKPGEIVGLIGPNGSGKTSLFNCITRIYTPQKGKISFCSQNILSLKEHQVVRAGISRTFQNLSLFPLMTTLNNVLLGAYHRGKTQYLSEFLRLPKVYHSENDLEQEALNLISFFDLTQYVYLPTYLIPFVAQKRIEIARALIAKPKLLLLDEPANGLNKEEAFQLADLILRVKAEFDMTILLIEHNMNLVMKLVDSIVVLDAGIKIADGTPSEIRENKAVIEAYLGTL